MRADVERLQRELRLLFNAWDLIGVCSLPDGGAPADEYKCLQGGLLATLGSSNPEPEMYLEKELAEHFGLQPSLLRIKEMCAVLLRWWLSRRGDDEPDMTQLVEQATSLFPTPRWTAGPSRALGVDRWPAEPRSVQAAARGTSRYQ
jgi:hypothetical protein